MKFGAKLASPCKVVNLGTDGCHLILTLEDGTEIVSRSALIATGVRYKKLPLPYWSHFEGAGIYYAATELEARACGVEPVTVVGGANSAGQAALFLAAHGSAVTLAIRELTPRRKCRPICSPGFSLTRWSRSCSARKSPGSTGTPHFDASP